VPSLTIMANDVDKMNLKIISFNVHGFMQGYCVLEDLIKDRKAKPDVSVVYKNTG